MSNIYITGVSGTGKTTIAKILKERGVKAYSTDEVPGLCHWENKVDRKIVDYEAKLDQEFINSHTWVCNIDHLKQLMNQEENVVILGMTGNQDEFLSLFDKVILLQCSPEIFIDRIQNREDNTFGKDKTAQEYILSMYKTFNTEMMENEAVVINTENPLDIVIKEIINELSK